jgi:hypothetical protein
MKSLLRVSVALIFVSLLAGCADSLSENIHDKSEQSRVQALAEAKAAGADQSQIDILDSEVTFDEFHQAEVRAMTCMTDAGLQIGYWDQESQTQREGYQIIRRDGQDDIYYSITIPEGKEDWVQTVQDECLLRYSYFVRMQYQAASSTTLAWNERRAEAMREPLMDCLSGYGVDVAAGASFLEMLAASSRHAEATGFTEDCDADIGFTDWDG